MATLVQIRVRCRLKQQTLICSQPNSRGDRNRGVTKGEALTQNFDSMGARELHKSLCEAKILKVVQQIPRGKSGDVLPHPRSWAARNDVSRGCRNKSR